jgi:hypothetical protein
MAIIKAQVLCLVLMVLMALAGAHAATLPLRASRKLAAAEATNSVQQTGMWKKRFCTGAGGRTSVVCTRGFAACCLSGSDFCLRTRNKQPEYMSFDLCNGAPESANPSYLACCDQNGAPVGQPFRE